MESYRRKLVYFKYTTTYLPTGVRVAIIREIGHYPAINVRQRDLRFPQLPHSQAYEGCVREWGLARPLSSVIHSYLRIEQAPSVRMGRLPRYFGI